MKQHLLLTPELRAKMPDSIEILANFGNVNVIFPSNEPNGKDKHMYGDNAVLGGSEEDFIKWLKEFDGVPIGSGVPQFEEFEIMHIKNDL